MLAEPSVELADHTWARLTDGTPLVTGAPRGRGWIVLFHVAASPGWSTLPISGLYVDMLRRVIELSEGVRGGAAAARTGTFPPYQTLDGYGHLEKPFPEATPIRASEIESTNVGPLHPPGLYGVQGALIALNAFGTRSMLTPLDIGRSVFPYSGTAARELKWPLLETALIILLIDALLSLWLRGYVSANRRKPRAAQPHRAAGVSRDSRAGHRVRRRRSSCIRRRPLRPHRKRRKRVRTSKRTWSPRSTRGSPMSPPAMPKPTR